MFILFFSVCAWAALIENNINIFANNNFLKIESIFKKTNPAKHLRFQNVAKFRTITFLIDFLFASNFEQMSYDFLVGKK